MNPSNTIPAEKYDVLEVERLTHNEHRDRVSFFVNRTIGDLRSLPQELSRITGLNENAIRMQQEQATSFRREGVVIECDLSSYTMPISWFFGILARTTADCVHIPYARTYLYGTVRVESVKLIPLTVFAKTVAKISLAGPMSVEAQQKEVRELESLLFGR